MFQKSIDLLDLSICSGLVTQELMLMVDLAPGAFAEVLLETQLEIRWHLVVVARRVRRLLRIGERLCGLFEIKNEFNFFLI